MDKVHEFFSKYWGCHQMPERSFFFRRYQFPLCARCTGILIREILSIPFIVIFHAHWQLIFLILPMALDGSTQFVEWRRSTNLLRLVTGLFGGYAITSMLVWVIKAIILAL
jgi:uncharacterized membrane protein